MSRRQRKILRKGDAPALLSCHNSIALDYPNKLIFKSEKAIRRYFELKTSHSCVDAAAHYSDCPWVIVEQTVKGVDHGVRQLENMAEFLEENGSNIRRAFLFIDRLVSHQFKTDLKGVLVNKSNNRRHLIGQSNSYVYVVLFNCTLRSVEKKISEVEKKEEN